MTDSETCLFCFHPPNGPSTPFATGDLMIIDSVRVVIMLGAAAIIALSVPALRRATWPGQMIRMSALIPLAVLVISIQIEHLGDGPSWRNPLALIGVWYAAYGLWLFLRYEQPDSAERLAARRRSRT